MSEAEPTPPALRTLALGAPVTPPQRLRDVDATAVAARPSGVTELDRVLGGGLVPGGVVLLAGEPGVGKSTLLLAAAQQWTSRGHGPALIVTGEETVGQVGLRARRLGAVHPDIYLAAETELSAVVAHVASVQPTLLVVDSIQTVSDAETDGGVGGVTQVRAVAAALTAVAKQRQIACVLVGHVTKDGSVAGPRVLEHLVDVVLHFEGDRHTTLRMIRGVKNRFGPADEVGCFAMTDAGIASLADPSGLFLTARARPVPGTCATVTVQGRRALPVEVQTLVGSAGSAESRRTVSGLDPSRVSMVLAVLQRWGGVRLGGQDVLAATVGGARTTEPASDLAIAMAVWSSVRDIPLSAGLVAIGEIGLAADVRPVPGVSRRLAEAARLGFDHAIVPVTDASGERVTAPAGMRVSAVADLGAALRALGDDSGVVRWLRERQA
jgi:DNA repair protein RadA/Sms